jgi:prophage antirepressor-like protein
MEKIVDVENMKFVYNNEKIYVIIANDDSIWFRANDILKLLGYVGKKQALKINVEEKNKKQLKELSDTYKSLYKNVQGQTIFINNEGFNNLIIKSNKPDAIEIQRWIANDVLPAIVEKGVYAIGKKAIAELKKVKSELDKVVKKKKTLTKQVEKYKNNQRKHKFLEKPAVYIIRSSTDAPKNQNKLGKTDNVSKRFAQYNTTVPDNILIVDVVYVEDPDGVEKCVLGMLNKYIYRDRKEYINCSANIIIDAIRTCVLFMEKRDILVEKMVMRGNQQSRISVDDNKTELFEIENDEEQTGGHIDENYYKMKVCKYAYKIAKIIEENGL